ncbi:hypothetical protein [Sphingomonas sp. PAMC 26621]|uniref:hypothetical protein n=1 Tax=Sphingomonas sp. PAMC 26621 TaxID=1112213 RepID=UPI001111477F|nr:hypothetical protein [Sphingomonas sp. PAMC 26621]
MFESTEGEAAVSDYPVTDRMRPQLARLMGDGWVQVLLARALALATIEIPWLSQASVSRSGDLEGLRDIGNGMDPKVFLEGRVVLLAQLLGLLVTFVGPALTWGLVDEIWPDIPPEDRDFGMEL